MGEKYLVVLRPWDDRLGGARRLKVVAELPAVDACTEGGKRGKT